MMVHVCTGIVQRIQSSIVAYLSLDNMFTLSMHLILTPLISLSLSLSLSTPLSLPVFPHSMRAHNAILSFPISWWIRLCLQL